jgi:sulfatase maturation enzyme AslB (radical SAM superfamily)
LGFELGIKEWESHHDHAKTMLARGSDVNGGIYPPWHFVYLNYRLAQLISKGKLSPKAFKKILDEFHALEVEIDRDQKV